MGDGSFAVSIITPLLWGLMIAFMVLHRMTRRQRDDHYRIGETIGHGGMGVVYEATDLKLNRRVAIKMLRDEYRLDDEARINFLDEARLVAGLKHPSIVNIHAIIEDESGPRLIFEHLDGRTLDQVLEDRKPMSLGEIKRVLKPVCEALEYAHARDVVHRDLKPANIMLAEAGVKVLDFGISRHAPRTHRAPKTASAVGTPHYMAPEQEYGLVCKQNDVFSLGAVLYEMATGIRPYEGSTQIKLSKDFVPVSKFVTDAPPELDELIALSLEPDPEKRLKSPSEFWTRLSAVPDFHRADKA